MSSSPRTTTQFLILLRIEAVIVPHYLDIDNMSLQYQA